MTTDHTVGDPQARLVEAIDAALERAEVASGRVPEVNPGTALRLDTQAVVPPSPSEPLSESPPESRDIGAGSVLRDRYVIQHAIGIGGNSIVFQAEDRHRESPEDANNRHRVALKVLRPQLRHNPYVLIRMRREFRQMQRLTHPGIARVFDLDCDGDVWFMTMERVNGRTITEWMKQDFEEERALRLLAACCDAVSYAHGAGIVHGDLKPSNVLVTDDGQIKLIDFGSAAAEVSGTSVAVSNRSFAATPPYASPQILTGQIADPRDDIFSLACVAYTMLTHGEHPFQRKTSLEAWREEMQPIAHERIHPSLFDVLVRGLAWERADRQANVGVFLRELLDAEEQCHQDVQTCSTVEVIDVEVDELSGEEAERVIAQWQLNPGGAMSREAQRVIPTSAATKKRPALAPLRLSNTAKQERPNRSAYSAARAVVPYAAHRRTGHSVTAMFAPHRRAVAAAAALAVIVVATFLRSPPQETAAAAATPATAISQPIPTAAPVARAEIQKPATPPPEQPAPLPLVDKTAPVAPAPVRGFVSFDAPIIRVGSGQSMAVLTVRRIESTRGRARVAWSVEGAKPGIDYKSPESQVITFLDGQTVRSLFIPLIANRKNATVDTDRSFSVKLRKMDGGPLVGPITDAKILIIGSEAAPIASVALDNSRGGM